MAAVVDISGYQIFSGSELGKAHVVAHRMLDVDLPDRGRRLLGDWLEGRDGEGSDWVHIQWHMLVFEIAVGDWDGAHRRYLRHVLPAALPEVATLGGSRAQNELFHDIHAFARSAQEARAA